MNKLVVLSAIIVAGCAPAPAPTPLPDLRAQIAVGGMLALMSPSPAPLPPEPPAPAPQPSPPPAPKPTPGVRCENCRGTGIVGDSRTGIRCPDCGGSGVVPAPKAAAPRVSTSGVSTDRVPFRGDQPTFRIVCEDGVCRRIKIEPPRK